MTKNNKWLSSSILLLGFLIIVYLIKYQKIAISQLTELRPSISSPVVEPGNYYVDTKGSDQGQGTKSWPWRTLNQALISVPPDQGYTIHLGVGSFEVGKKVAIPSGVNIVGSGNDSTTIIGEFSLSDVKNLTISNIKFSGNKYKYNLGMYIRDAHKLVLHDLVFNAYTSTAIDMERITDANIYNIKITDSTYNKWIGGGGGNQSSAIGLGNLTNVDLHDITIDTRARGGQGIKSVNDAWPKEHPWTAPSGILKNVRFYNLDIQVDQLNSWSSGWTPQMALELWSHDCYQCEIFNSKFNSTVSLASFSNDKLTSTRVHDNVWYGPKNPFYACEVSSDNIEFDHNYIRGGMYPIASFGGKYKNLDVHHNIFETTSEPFLVVDFIEIRKNFKFRNNTVYINNSKARFFGLAKEDSSQEIHHNIFYNASGQINNFLGVSVGVTNNLFFNVKPVGNDAMIFNPQFKFSGNKPSPYYISDDRRLVNFGAIEKP